MKKALSAFCVALCCVCSRADTNDVFSALEELQNTLSSISSQVASINDEVTGNTGNGGGVWYALWQIDMDIGEVMNSALSIDSFLRNNITRQLASLLDIRNSLVTVNNRLDTINTSLQSFNSVTNDVSAIHSLLQTVNVNLGSCKASLQALVQYVSDIRNYASSLPQIEEYQSALSVIVSNINEHILAGINVSIPNTINVNVQNPQNFNPEWDFLSRAFQWGGWSFDNTWQQFSSPDSQDNTLQGAAPMSIPATTTLAEYLENLYTGINNSGRILNDSIVHACYLLEGSNTVSQAEQEEASESVDSSISGAPTKMEEVSSSIPTPSFGVDTSYIRRGLGFWDHVYNIQKPTSIILRTSASEGNLVSVPEIYIEIKLSDYPALDKVLEFCRAVFTWLWWVLSVFFLVWLFKRGFALYTMVMGMLGPKPVQATANDVI